MMIISPAVTLNCLPHKCTTANSRPSALSFNFSLTLAMTSSHIAGFTTGCFRISNLFGSQFFFRNDELRIAVCTGATSGNELLFLHKSEVSGSLRIYRKNVRKWTILITLEQIRVQQLTSQTEQTSRKHVGNFVFKFYSIWMLSARLRHILYFEFSLQIFDGSTVINRFEMSFKLYVSNGNDKCENYEFYIRR